MIPTAEKVVIGEDYEIVDDSEQPSRTYRIDFKTGRVIGFVDGLEAMRQAIFKILQTERFDYLIYSWNYGAELNDIVGIGSQVFESEVKRRIKEALTWDRRITDVTGFNFTRKDKRTMVVEFTAETIFGDVQSEVEVITSV